MELLGTIRIRLGDEITAIEVYEDDTDQEIQNKVDAWMDDNWPACLGERYYSVTVSESEE